MKRLEVKIRGHVQGVGFRYFCAREAGRLGLTGVVENMPDGSLAVVAEGDEYALKEFEGLVRHGPSTADVVSYESEWSDARATYHTFHTE